MNCEVCGKGSGKGGTHEARLVAPNELQKAYIAQAMKDPENRASLCRPCHLALNVLCRRAAPDDTTSPTLVLYREKLDGLVARRNRIRQAQLQGQMFLSFGRVESQSRFKGRLEGELEGTV